MHFTYVFHRKENFTRAASQQKNVVNIIMPRHTKWWQQILWPQLPFIQPISFQHVIDLEGSMNELQDKVVSLQQEKSGLAERLASYKRKLDSQEQSLSLTRDEREELLQVKVCAGFLQKYFYHILY